MSRALIISDVHLKPVIFDRAEKILESGQADFAVQLGDLFDDWGEEYNSPLYERTLNRAVAFHKKFPKTLWAMGNHDFGYYHPTYGRRCSGHTIALEYDMHEWLKRFEKAGIKQKVVHVVDNVIFSHAGVTAEWASRVLLDADREDPDFSVGWLLNRALAFDLWEMDSPIWARPQDEAYEMFSDKMQVVGHTPVEKISFVDNLLSTDVFSTYRNGAPFGERKFAIVDTEREKWSYAEEEK